MTVIIGAVAHLRQHLHGDAEQVADRLAPPTLADIVKQRARGIGGVGGMHAPAGQFPDQKAVHRAKEQIARRGLVARALDVLQYPAQFRAREIRIEQQPRALGHHRLVPRLAQLRAVLGGAPVLPDDGAVNGLPGMAIPDHGRLALIGDADGSHIGDIQPRLLDHRAAGARRGRPQIARLMLDPARLREMLVELFLCHGPDPHLRIEQDRAARRGALVDGEDMGHGSVPVFVPVILGLDPRISEGDHPVKPDDDGPRSSRMMMYQWPPGRAERAPVHVVTART